MRESGPEAAAVLAPIRFGTSGWRGILADEITAPRMRALAIAVARWACETQRAPRILVAHDTRFLGPQLARLAYDALAASGARPLRAAGPVPTPVVAHAVRSGVADAALIVTASHNEPAYQGVKVLASWGGGVTAEQARRIERHAAALRAPAAGPAAKAADGVDLVTPYLRNLAALFERDALRGTGLKVVYDALHGTGSGVCDRALRALGAQVEILHADHTPRFGGDRAGSDSGATRRIGVRGARAGRAHTGARDRRRRRSLRGARRQRRAPLGERCARVAGRSSGAQRSRAARRRDLDRDRHARRVRRRGARTAGGALSRSASSTSRARSSTGRPTSLEKRAAASPGSPSPATRTESSRARSLPRSPCNPGDRCARGCSGSCAGMVAASVGASHATRARPHGCVWRRSRRRRRNVSQRRASARWTRATACDSGSTTAS